MQPLHAVRIATLASLLLAWPAAEADADPPVALALQQVVTGLSLPVAVTHAGDGSGRLFVTQQGGEIRIFDGAQLLATPFLDLSGLVSCCGEQGLLSVAFHPDYPSNGFFYVNYTDLAGDTVVARYQVSADPNQADPTSASIVFTLAQPFGNHNGGQLHFGPDGYLYIATGDGGSGGDPDDRAQDLGDLLGKLLRIDVDGASPYAIPPDNPFVGVPGALDEIWAYGLRNPWRFGFDRANGDLFVADVGQSSREEVNFQPAASPGGENYGWRRMEGSLCFNPPSNCNDGSLVLPIAEYDHTLGCSVTGGYRYRGSLHPHLLGFYLYGDFCSGRIWGARESGGTWTSWELLDTSLQIAAFGEGEGGEIYLVHRPFGTGTLYRVTSPLPCSDGLDNDGDTLVDHPADPGCESALSSLEAPACDDELDNDGDGGVDWDGGSGGGAADVHCVTAWRNSERSVGRRCGLGFELAPLLLALGWLAARRRGGAR